MTVAEAKIDVCMTAVDVLKNTMRDFGAVCENCVNYHPYNDRICRPDGHHVISEGFCESFRYRNADACEPIYQKIVERFQEDEKC